MTIASMTGFAESTGSHEGLRWRWETKSVNGRSLDLRLRMPPGFDSLEQPVRMLAAERFRLVITSHHILLDGWSGPLLVGELAELYRAGGDDSGLGPVTPYRDYLAWLAGRDTGAAEAAWRRALAGLGEAALLVPADPARPDVLPERVTVELTRELTAALAALARSYDLTMSTVVQGAWGWLLSVLTGRSDVVFGSTVAGRPPELPGAETMIGLFINTVPVRVCLDPAEPAAGFLRRLQDEQVRLGPHQHLSLARIQALAGVGELFDTAVAFENYPGAGGDPAAGGGGGSAGPACEFAGGVPAGAVWAGAGDPGSGGAGLG